MSIKNVMPAVFSENKVQGGLFGEGKVIAKYYTLLDGGVTVMNHPSVKLDTLPEDKAILITYDPKNESPEAYFMPVTKPTVIIARATTAAPIDTVKYIIAPPDQKEYKEISFAKYIEAFRSVIVRSYPTEREVTAYTEAFEDMPGGNYITLTVEEFAALIVYHHTYTESERGVFRNNGELVA